MAPNNSFMRTLKGVLKGKYETPAHANTATEAPAAPAAPAPVAPAAAAAADDRSLCMTEHQHQHKAYTIVKLLGKGAFGEVYEAQNAGTHELVAIKVLKRHSCNRYVTTELVNHNQLAHPNIIRFNHVWLSSNHINVVMELANAGSLFSFIRQSGGKLQEHIARPLFQQLILAVDYCHRKGVANRDIKLENLLLHRATSEDPLQLKLCDFGYSKLLAASPQTAVGTPAYLPPEVLQSGLSSVRMPYDGSAADLWCCGVALYAMLIGQYPFLVSKDPPRSELLELLQKMQKHQYHLSSTLSPDCRRLLKGLLTANPAERLTIDDIRRDLWFAVGLDAGLFDENEAHAAREITPLQSEQEIRLLMDAVMRAYS
eukprot:gene3671-3932_t